MKTQLFNYERSLGRLGGDADLFREIAVMFLEDSPVLLEQAKAGLHNFDSPTLERAAHSLKGLSANFEAIATSTAAAKLEEHARESNWTQAAGCLAELETQVSKLQEALALFNMQQDAS